MIDDTDLSVPLEDAVTDLTLAIGQILRRLRTESNAGELTWSQTSALAKLDKSGWMTTADLARTEAVKPQSMGTTLADLEQAGLVQRRPHPTDGRQVLFGLTPEGVEARRKRQLAKRHYLLTALGKLDPAERQALIAVIPLIKRLSES